MSTRKPNHENGPGIVQYLVKLNNSKTHLICFERDHEPTATEILTKLALKTKLPSSILRLHHSQASRRGEVCVSTFLKRDVP